jgi:beta-lactamase regulating signal transducer with metallopeptidase domain
MSAAFVALVNSALVISAATALVALASRVWRRSDAALWHQVWTTLAVMSLVMPIIAGVLPLHARMALPASLDQSLARMAGTAVVSEALDILAILYGVGVTVATIRLVAGLCIVRRLVTRSTVPEGLPADRLRESIGVAALRCRVNQRLQVPITVGWMDPLVLLPPTWILWDAARRDAVVRHELAHTARRDYVWNLLAAIQHALYWFSPAAWIIARRIRLTAELTCDQRAASIVGPSRYAQVLVQTARDATRNGTRAGILAVGAMTELEARVEALVSATTSGVASSRRLRISVGVGIALILAAASAVRIGIGATSPDRAFGADHRASHQAEHQAHHPR